MGRGGQRDVRDPLLLLAAASFPNLPAEKTNGLSHPFLPFLLLVAAAGIFVYTQR